MYVCVYIPLLLLSFCKTYVLYRTDIHIFVSALNCTLCLPVANKEATQTKTLGSIIVHQNIQHKAV